jgi:hypothetical protein
MAAPGVAQARISGDADLMSPVDAGGHPGWLPCVRIKQRRFR